MTHPKAYEPRYRQKYQILTKYKDNREFDHCDYAKDKQEKNYLLDEYKLAFGSGFTFKTILLPKKYWETKETVMSKH